MGDILEEIEQLPKCLSRDFIGLVCSRMPMRSFLIAKGAKGLAIFQEEMRDR